MSLHSTLNVIGALTMAHQHYTSSQDVTLLTVNCLIQAAKRFLGSNAKNHQHSTVCGGRLKIRTKSEIRIFRIYRQIEAIRKDKLDATLWHGQLEA
jgi:hypothetical protein